MILGLFKEYLMLTLLMFFSLIKISTLKIVQPLRYSQGNTHSIRCFTFAQIDISYARFFSTKARKKYYHMRF